MKAWRRVSIDEPVKIGWRYLTNKTFLTPAGDEARFYTYEKVGIRHGAVIALTDDNRVVIAKQFRPGPEKVMHELPGGNINDGEDPQNGVMRELLEETGYTSDKVEFLGKTYKDAYHNATWYFYMARDCYKVSNQKLDETEFVDVELISIEQLIQNAMSSQMTDAVALLFAYDRLKEIMKDKEK